MLADKHGLYTKCVGGGDRGLLRGQGLASVSHTCDLARLYCCSHDRWLFLSREVGKEVPILSNIALLLLDPLPFLSGGGLHDHGSHAIVLPAATRLDPCARNSITITNN